MMISLRNLLRRQRDGGRLGRGAARACRRPPRVGPRRAARPGQRMSPDMAAGTGDDKGRAGRRGSICPFFRRWTFCSSRRFGGRVQKLVQAGGPGRFGGPRCATARSPVALRAYRLDFVDVRAVFETAPPIFGPVEGSSASCTLHHQRSAKTAPSPPARPKHGQLLKHVPARRRRSKAAPARPAGVNRSTAGTSITRITTTRSRPTPAAAASTALRTLICSTRTGVGRRGGHRRSPGGAGRGLRPRPSRTPGAAQRRSARQVGCAIRATIMMQLDLRTTLMAAACSRSTKATRGLRTTRHPRHFD